MPPIRLPFRLYLGTGQVPSTSQALFVLGGGQTRFEFVLVHVGAVGLVHETERVHPVRQIDLSERNTVAGLELDDRTCLFKKGDEQIK